MEEGDIGRFTVFYKHAKAVSVSNKLKRRDSKFSKKKPRQNGSRLSNFCLQLRNVTLSVKFSKQSRQENTFQRFDFTREINFDSKKNPVGI